MTSINKKGGKIGSHGKKPSAVVMRNEVNQLINQYSKHAITEKRQKRLTTSKMYKMGP
jgi:hypothetical protein